LKDSFLTINDSDVDKPFRIKQLKTAVFSNGIIDLNNVTTIPFPLRNQLIEKFEIVSLREETRQVSTDGTVKFLFRLNDDHFIESVFLIDKNNHVTFCISSQVGCRMGCVFCQTGKMGLLRNLTSYEIVSQVIFLYSFMVNEKKIDDRLFNIVFMGMGEPLDTIDEVIKAIGFITEKNNFSLSPTRITVSTCGILDKIEQILTIYPTLRVAVSLNSAIQEERMKIMPITKKFSVRDIESQLKRIYFTFKNRITLEYVLIKGVNDTIEDINALEIFNNEAFHLNIIPLNHSDNSISRPDEKAIKHFIDTLENKGFCVTRRYRRGDDIKADCGQLYYEKSQEALDIRN